MFTDTEQHVLGCNFDLSKFKKKKKDLKIMIVCIEFYK